LLEERNGVSRDNFQHDDLLVYLEKQFVLAAYEYSGGNRKRTREILGIAEYSLTKYLKTIAP
jgi:hypothetical protein